jgi:hypothetical protein
MFKMSSRPGGSYYAGETTGQTHTMQGGESRVRSHFGLSSLLGRAEVLPQSKAGWPSLFVRAESAKELASIALDS